MTPLDAIEAHLTAELERLRAGGESCPGCDSDRFGPYSPLGCYGPPCLDCNGTGKSPTITAAEEVLKLAIDERKRLERLLAWLENTKGTYSESWARQALAEYNAPVPTVEEESNETH